jgi:pimeloyl-ACP methyl ester carboxylesterase
MHQSIPNARIEIFEGIGHMPNLEATDRFNAILHDYLAGVSPQHVTQDLNNL